ncbi:MAG: hypothetical protein Q8P32_01420 [Candidatus Komeilibacteria bacterium]|nr:hypothetical protein [Candidatus Komeilibacteria bacterium]
MSSPEQAGEKLEHLSNREQLIGLFHDLEGYNDKFQSGRIAGRLIIGSVRKNSDDNIADEQIDPYLNAQELIGKNQVVAGEFGLSLTPISRKDQGVFAQGEKISPSEMRVDLSDPSKFVDFLSHLESETLSPEEIKALQYIAESLKQQLVSEYDLGQSEDDRLLNLFAGLERIIENYRRLDPDGQKGFNDVVNSLEKYLTMSRQGIMREYILAEKNNILPQPLGSGFGPSSFQIDISPEDYQERWRRIFEVLEKIKNNHKAGDFYDEIYSYLKDSILYAQKDVEQKIKEYRAEKGISIEYWQNLKKVIPGVIEELLEY